MSRLGAAVNIVTTDGPAGRAGFTASAVCSVTDEPPTLLVCLNRTASVYPAFEANGVLCVNVLARGPPGTLRPVRRQDADGRTLRRRPMEPGHRLAGARRRGRVLRLPRGELHQRRHARRAVLRGAAIASAVRHTASSTSTGAITSSCRPRLSRRPEADSRVNARDALQHDALHVLHRLLEERRVFQRLAGDSACTWTPKSA
jgi:hypothetical protein